MRSRRFRERSDIILINITDLDKPVSFNLTKDPSVIREDPNLDWSSLPAVMGTGSEATVAHRDPRPGASFCRVKVERP